MATLCRRLDGFAAGHRADGYKDGNTSIKALADRPDDQLPVLSMTGSRSAPTRHHTLRAVLAS